MLQVAAFDVGNGMLKLNTHHKQFNLSFLEVFTPLEIYNIKYLEPLISLFFDFPVIF